jgi:hypothetical protein
MLLLSVIAGAIMGADMGTFRVAVEIENPANPGEKRTISSVLVARQLVDAGPAPAAVA